MWIAALALLTVFLLLSLMSGTATIGSIAKGVPILVACCLWIPVLFTFCTYIGIDEKELKSVAWLFMRAPIHVSRIREIRCYKTFVGLVTSVDVLYINEGGKLSHKTIGTVEAYGAITISTILRELQKINKSITLNGGAEKLINTR